MTEEEVNKLIVGTFRTPLGERLLEYFREKWVDKPIYRQGMSLDTVAFHEGRRDAIMQILKEMEKSNA